MLSAITLIIRCSLVQLNPKSSLWIWQILLLERVLSSLENIENNDLKDMLEIEHIN